MSKYTTELRFICESEAGYLEQQGYSKVNEIVEAARTKIFSFDYPIFDESYRPGLETKILKHYYTREIAAETYGRWKLFLESRMIEIMPYYNELYRSTLEQYDIFEDVNYIRSGNRTTDEDGTHQDQDVTATETSNTGSVTTSDVTATETSDSGSTNTTKVIDTDTTETGTAWDKYSDTPQGSVQNLDNDTYLTNARKNTINNSGTNDTTETDTGTSTNSGTVDTTETINTSTSDTGTIDTTVNNTGSHTRDVLEEYSELIKGKMPGKSYMQMIQEFRDIILNIDKMVIDELSDLFMMIY